MKKYLLSWLTILMAATVSVGFASCSNDDDDETERRDYIEDSKESGEDSHETDGKIDTEVFVIEDHDILMGVNDIGNGWYSYVLQFAFGASSDDAYRKGMTQMRLTAWADNGIFDMSYKTANYGKKKTYTLYLSSTQREWYDWIYVQSKDSQLKFNYTLEYYNSKNGQWYEVKSKKLTFNK